MSNKRAELLEKMRAAGRPPTIQETASPTVLVSNQDQASTAPASSLQRRKRAEMDLTYCDYNLSTMHDSKGGFIRTEEPAEKKPKPAVKEPTFFNTVDLSQNAQCRECYSLDVNTNYQKYYGVDVCRDCEQKLQDKYALLTKTECRQDYLLTDSELRDHDKMPWWEKPNPHKSTYANMQLYLRMQVENFAIEKWGSLEKLDEEFNRRKAEKELANEKKLKRNMNGS
ncbi:hypothetical protein HK101_010699 [Irineochytrium annulatum]|nr:hypothetical protein HK101_010699 [Irineochytrium annulatum]